MLRSVIRDLLIAAFLFTATGCLISSTNSVNETGRHVSSGTLNQVELGKTSKEWLIGVAGEPTSHRTVSESPRVEILGYEHQIVKSSSGTVLFVFAGSSHKSTSEQTFFEVTDGIVTRYWTEK